MCEKFIPLLAEHFEDVKALKKDGKAVAGGNSKIYLTTIDGAPAVIKVFSKLKEEGRYKRFVEELRIIPMIKHISGVVPVIAYTESPPERMKECEGMTSIDDIAYIVMPFYPATLSHKLSQFAGDDGTKAVAAILSIASIIKRLHDEGFMHRDLKPDNILIDAENNFLVSDYGLCIDLDREIKRHTANSELVGAVNYRAPEYLRGRLDEADHRPGDIFSLGRMLVALLMGKELFNVTDWEFEQSLADITAPLRKSIILQDIIRASTNVDPKRRPSIDEFITYLESWLMEHSPQSADAAVAKILGSDTIRARIRATTMVNEIKQQHNETVNFITAQLSQLTLRWQAILEQLAAHGIGSRLNEVSIRSDFDRFGIQALNDLVVPTGEVSGLFIGLNPGDLDSAPFLYCALYVFYDLNNIDNQHYAVVAIHKLPGQEPQLTLSVQIKPFSYTDTGIRQKILTDLTVATTALDEILTDWTA
ncbi:protein kinase [Mucilaginibacter mali]|uniref:Protein kinase n=1 Tax=Mucilaginibacter mali TaxID=2740462 RepID=A0A7D4UF80_9SPHI|nr:protein kinase [Mucilaginibacter mali]QKJ32459.1 protein kinase [Mucilaginibacter mali]